MSFKRSSGILLHPTSLPGNFGIGDLGASAYHFVDWLKAAGQSLWQMLPIGPSGLANSPYMSSSAFAGNPLLVDLYDLVQQGWLAQEDLESRPHFEDYRVNYTEVVLFRTAMLKKASKIFFKNGNAEQKKIFESFCLKEKEWLNDYALFQTLNWHNNSEEWTTWDKDLKTRNPRVLRQAEQEFFVEIAFHKFVQWRFAVQWKTLKQYANQNGIQLIGDIPFFVAQHSADVWGHPREFLLAENGEPLVVAGVPPDYFSETGQRWGNPQYNWKTMKRTHYLWWIDRFERMFELFDIVRIDHFRAFESYWEIPADEETAVKGTWVQGPGEDFFKTANKIIGALPIIAEDLGIITDKIRALRKSLAFPGMYVLQFAFSGGPENSYLPHRFDKNMVVYTGTHDNDTTRGWYEKANEHEKDFVRRYCHVGGENIHWDLINLALQSTADVAVTPFQDVMGLGSEARMNIPGTIDGNWEWRFRWDQVGSFPAEHMYELSALYGRTDPGKLSLK